MTLQELKSQFPAAPEYLTQIFLIERDHGIVPNARLADRLEVSRPAVSQAVGRLKKLGLVDQDRYGAIGLTQEGRTVAENVVKRHFLVEHVLVGILNYPWDKSDVEAETLQASLSDELTSFLVKKLGNPQTCPHGNPMPGSAIEKAYLEAPSLEDAGVGTKIKIIRITEEGEMTDGMLSFCQENGIEPGRKVTVVEQQPGKGTLCEIEGRELHIPSVFSANLRWEAA
jgi:DtxR family Mn-dependent transcriptional regulator